MSHTPKFNNEVARGENRGPEVKKSQVRAWETANYIICRSVPYRFTSRLRLLIPVLQLYFANLNQKEFSPHERQEEEIITSFQPHQAE